MELPCSIVTNNKHHEGASQSPYRPSHSKIMTETQLSSKPKPRSNHWDSFTLKPNNHSPIYKLIAPWTVHEPQRVGVEVKGLTGLPNTKTVVACFCYTVARGRISSPMFFLFFFNTNFFFLIFLRKQTEQCREECSVNVVRSGGVV